MRLLLLCIILLAPFQDTVSDLINAYESTKDIQEKITILEKLGIYGDPSVTLFLSKKLDKERDPNLLGKAFEIWGRRMDGEVLEKFLNKKVASPGFRSFIPIIPSFPQVDAFEILKNLFQNESLAPYKRLVGETIATLNSELALMLLREAWSKCMKTEEGLWLLAAIQSMNLGEDPLFMEELLESRHAFARLQGARYILDVQDSDMYTQAMEFLRHEVHPRVRREFIKDLAKFQTHQAAAVILKSSVFHAETRLHEVVTTLASMPHDSVKVAAKEDWYLDGKPLYYKILALTFTTKGFLERLDKEGISLIKKGMKDQDEDVRAVAVAAYSRIPGNEDSAKTKTKIASLIGSGSLDTQWRVMDALQNFKIHDELVIAKVLKLFNASGRNWALRIRAAQFAGALRLREAMPYLIKSLSHKRLYVRIGAIKALGVLFGEESIKALIKALKKEKGRAAWEIVRSLRDLTGRDFGIDAAKWEKWLESGNIPVLPKALREDPWKPAGEKNDKYGFYGMSIDSHNIMFVLDTSGSMNQGGRIQRLRQELTKTLKSLSGDHFINMIFFNDHIRMWRDRLVPLQLKKTDSKAGALMTVRYANARGGTNLYGALKAAFQDEEVDTIVLLTDGDPTVGEMIDQDAILREVKEWNKINQLTIHVVALGAVDRYFVRQLALATGGNFLFY